MDDVKMNFKTMHSDLSCDLCHDDAAQDTAHLLDCQKLIDNCPDLYNDTQVEYDHIFKETNQQLKAIKLYCKVFKVKISLLESLT